MKKSIVIAVAGLLCLPVIAQENKTEEGYKFTIAKELPVTSVKNQAKAGTCWDYAGTAFLEAELLRMGKGEYDLSEMFNAYND